jgi:hypothetical protein
LKNTYHPIVLLFLLVICLDSFSQNDSLRVVSDTTINAVDSSRFVRVDSMNKKSATVSNKKQVDSILKYHSPRKAAVRSAIVPGLGQIYNKKYWKVPIIYGALGISASIFVYNLKWYRRTRFAYTTLVTHDTANFDNVHPDLVGFVNRGDAQALQSYRNEFRRNIDYSAVFFIVLWGLNVVDAAVDAHLKSFDISPDLSFKLKFGQSELAGTNGVSLVLAFK